MKKINICVIGARSYSAGHLLKLLAEHEHVTINMFVSTEKEGEDIQKIHPFLRGVVEGQTIRYNKEKVVENNDLVFLHKGHGEFHEDTTELLNWSSKVKKPVRVIDLSADFRLRDSKLYDRWYQFKRPHSDAGKVWLKKAVYGLTELYRDKIKKAILVANPGCYPTATLLALAPLLRGGFVDTDQPIFIDALSGVSGAGNQNNGSNLAIEVEQNVKPYKVGHVHQHVPEMEQEISNMLNKKIQVTFAPHLLQFKYGILSTHYLTLKESYDWEEIASAYKEMYEHEPFIRIMNSSDKKTFPEVKNVEGTNFCDIGFVTDKDSKVCVVMGAIDNIIKGASGQAIQNMNVMYGFEETEGLPYSKALRAKFPQCSISLVDNR
jgi:N-acetyl-gamma-glutamyl-phosphate reductase